MTKNDTNSRKSQSSNIDEMAVSGLPEYYTKRNIIFGCGNILFGDDGFGPKVIEHYLAHYKIPEDTYFLDIGTGIRNILFDMIIAERKPENVIIIDAVDKDRKPGEIFEIDVEEIPMNKINDFSVHQIPTINMLKEIRDECGINVVVLACQVDLIPDEISPGLSDKVEASVEAMCDIISKKINEFS
jgi:coenzyme F420 hydrogenase subunit delta